MKRLFFQISIPEEFKEWIEKEFLEKIPEGMKKAEKENLHITLLFAGNATDEEAKKFIEKCNEIDFQEFELELNSVGEFGKRVLWIGLNSQSKPKDLSVLIQEKTNLRDNRFHAHITVARNKSLGISEFKKLMQSFSEDFSKKFAVCSFSLMESVLTETGPEYRELKRFTLKPSQELRLD